MAQAVSGLEVVLGDGRVVRTGAWAIGGVPPFGRPPLPDLGGLFTSFQGTTGIATKLAFQLWPRHALEKRLFVLGYSSAGVFTAMRRLCRLEVCEDIGGLSWPNARMMMGVARPDPVPDPGEPRWFLYLDLAADRPEDLASREALVGRVLDEGRREGERFEAPLDVRALLRLGPALGAFAEFPVDLTFLTRPPGGGMTWMGTYGPLPAFAEVADLGSAIMVERGFPPAIVSRAMWGGHFGVLRFLVTFDRNDPAEAGRVRGLMEALLEAVTRAGFAMYKTPPWALSRLASRIDPTFLDLVRAVKRLTDPHGILNPGRWDL
jgi:FAD/FMN-containing dehydrogenase